MSGQQQVTIGAGTSLSGAIDLGISASLVAVQFPAGWTAAGFQVVASNDGVNYGAVQDQLGVIVGSAQTALANLNVCLDPYTLVGFRYIKIQSGTVAVPVIQVGAVTLTLSARSMS